jgi:hypothetical protein
MDRGVNNELLEEAITDSLEETFANEASGVLAITANAKEVVNPR